MCPTMTMTGRVVLGSRPGRCWQRGGVNPAPPPSSWRRWLSSIAAQPATECDDDHTLAHDKGGITCECGLGPT